MHVNNMISFPCKIAINLLTQTTNHSKTLIDDIYFNDFNKQTTSGKIILDLSNHYGTFILISKYCIKHILKNLTI